VSRTHKWGLLSNLPVDPVIICNRDKARNLLPEVSLESGFKIEKCDLALVKPNICGIYHPSIGLLSAVIRYLDNYADKIVIGETRSMMHNPESQFNRLGINDLAAEFGDHVETVDLSEQKTTKVRIPKPHILKEIELPHTVVGADLLFNVPKVGTHRTTRITNALKNLFGVLPQKHKYSVYHPLGIDNVIADIAQVIKPDLNITDAGEKAIVGVDPLAVDIVACRFVDLDPLNVKHLRLVSEDRGVKLEDQSQINRGAFESMCKSHG
jgi:uncharacterized protein (DUF362 family)